MAAQTFNFQTFYTQELEYLDNDLDYYRSIDGNLDEYQKPVIYNGLYKLAWDYFALQQNTTHNLAAYNIVAAVVAIAVGDPRHPAVIDTNTEFIDIMNLYCRNIGLILAGLLNVRYNDNITELKIWLTENPVFQMSLPVVGLTHTPLATAAVNVATDGARLIGVYAVEAFLIAIRDRATGRAQTDIDLQNIQTLNQSVADCTAECVRFRALLAAVNASIAGAARTVAQITLAFNPIIDGLPSSRAKYAEHLLLAVNRSTIIEMDNYNTSVKMVANTLPLRTSEIDQRIKNEVQQTVQESKTGDVVLEAPQGDELVNTVFTKGLDTDRDKLITGMPKRITHTLMTGCNNLYYGVGGPTVKIMSYGGRQYVCPIQTRDGTDVNDVRTEFIPELRLTIEGKQAVTAAAAVVAANQYKIIGVPGGIPGPNPQPLKERTLGLFGSRAVNTCTTDPTDVTNMTQLPANYISRSKEPGHGDWQSMPNYATLWMIALTANTKNITPEADAAYLFSERQSGIKCFTFQSILVGRDKFVVPKNDSNCMLPSNWELFAMHPSGKLLYHNNSTQLLQVNPPPGSYWKQWNGAKYIHSYMAEIGYQKAKENYEDKIRVQNLQRLPPGEEEELFQRGAHDGLMKYVETLTTYRARGGSVNNNKKRYNKKTMMSILKTAKRKYFTRRNKTKQ
jgi:hypothetical protein